MLDNLWMQALHISAEHKKLVILGGLMGEGVGSWAAKTELQQRRRDGWWCKTVEICKMVLASMPRTGWLFSFIYNYRRSFEIHNNRNLKIVKGYLLGYLLKWISVYLVDKISEKPRKSRWFECCGYHPPSS